MDDRKQGSPRRIDDSEAPRDQLPEELLSSICEAIGTYSPTYHEDPALALFERTAGDLGLETQRDYVDATRYNLVIRASYRAPEVVLVGHIDTIAATDTHQPQAVIDNGKLYGLGAVDMKATCALMLYALKLETDGGPAAEIHLVVGEEEYGDGAAVSATRLNERCRAAQSASTAEEHEGPLVVVGEPSALRPCTEHFSYYEAHLSTRGVRVHAGLPELGANAVVAMLDRISEITATVASRSDMVCNPRMIHGGSEEFLVPHICEAQIDIHTHPSVRISDIESLLTPPPRRTFASPDTPEAQQSRHAVDFTFRRAFYSEGYTLDRNDPRLQPLRAALEQSGRPWNPGAFRSHSDAPIYRSCGFPTVICGPGHLETAHTVDEHIALADLSAGLAVYRALIRRTCREYCS